MESAANQGFFSGGLWSGVFFAIGILALLWVIRRNIFLRRRTARLDHDQGYQLVVAKARREIAEIDLRTWIDHYKHAVKFRRGQMLQPEQREFLQTMTSYQHRVRGNV